MMGGHNSAPNRERVVSIRGQSELARRNFPRNSPSGRLFSHYHCARSNQRWPRSLGQRDKCRLCTDAALRALT